METLAYLYFTESYEDSDSASSKLQQHQEPQSNAATELSNAPASTPGDQSVSMQPTGYDPKVETQPNWMML